MRYHPSSNMATPLIVAGPQRSGTRFVTNVLNSIPGVTLQGEIPESIMDKIIDLAQKCNNKYSNSERSNIVDDWEDNKIDFLFSAWANLSQGKRKKKESNCIFYGYKSPFHEKYFDFYSTFLYPIRPKYICCIRPFLPHYFSVQARWPNKKIWNVVLRYVRSLNQIRRIKQERPQDVFLFFLEDYKEQGFPYFYEYILDPLGLKDVDRAEKQATKGPANASAQLGLKKRTRLSGKESLFLKMYPQPFKKYELLRRDFS